MNQPIKRVSHVVPELAFAEKTLKLAEIEGVDVTLLAGKILDGEYGEYAMLSVRQGDIGDATVASGAQNVVLMTKRLMADNAFPVLARFTKKETSKGREVWTIE